MATTFYTVWSRILDSDDEGCTWVKGFRTRDAAKAAIEEDRKYMLDEDNAEAQKPLEWTADGEVSVAGDRDETGVEYRIAPIEIED